MTDGHSLTAEQFAEAYARRSGVSVEWLAEHGREVRRCGCGSEDCPGWQMARVREDPNCPIHNPNPIRLYLSRTIGTQLMAEAEQLRVDIKLALSQGAPSSTSTRHGQTDRVCRFCGHQLYWSPSTGHYGHEPECAWVQLCERYHVEVK